MKDIRLAFRALRKNTGFTVVAVLTLALGIGANTAIFSVLKAVVLNDLPYRQPERLVMIAEAQKRTLNPTTSSYATFMDWKTRSHSFEKMALYRNWGALLVGQGEPEQLRGMRVSREFFDLLGVQPYIGRQLLAEEDQPERWHTVLLSYGFWKRRFGGDTGIVGRTITLDDDAFVVAGVLPASFSPIFFQTYNRVPDVWAPLGYGPALNFACRTCQHLRTIARLNPGVTVEQARAEMAGITRGMVSEYPKDYPADAFARIVPVRDALVGKIDIALRILLGAVGLVLLIACANVANLMLARATGRQREMAVRAALGASRGRLIRQLLTESVLLALAGGLGGILLATWGTALLVAKAPPAIPRLNEVQVDGWVLLFTLAASVLTGMIFGSAPALAASRVDLTGALKEGSKGSEGRSRGGLRDLLVVGELALAFVLAVGAGLLVKSFVRLVSVDPGFEPRQLVTLNIALGGSRYKEDPAVVQFHRQAMERIRALPDVEAAGLVSTLPMSANFDRAGFYIQDRPVTSDADAPSVDRYQVTPDYLHAMKIPLLRGRAFTDQDGPQAPAVALVSESLARKQWPNEDPVGKHIQLGEHNEKLPWSTIVGIVGDVHQYGLDTALTEQAYQPAAQQPFSFLTVVVRSATEPAALEREIRTAIGAIDKNAPVYGVASMDELFAVSLAERRFTMTLLGVFGLLAIVLAAVGIYGVISYSVSLRAREVGIRMALGAARADVLRLVLRQGLVLVGAGLGAGVAASFALTRYMESLLFQVKPADVLTTSVVVVLLSAVALLASYVPARRATKVDPMVALRYE